MAATRHRIRIAVGVVTAATLLLAVWAGRDRPGRKESEAASPSEPGTESAGPEVKAIQGRLSAQVVEQQLASLLASIPHPTELALQVRRIIESADLSDPAVGERLWDFVIRHLVDESEALESLGLLGRRWVIADRASAWRFLSAPDRFPPGSDPGPFQRQYLLAGMTGVLIEWTEWDRGEALHLARTVESAVLREGLLSQLYRKWAESDPETAWMEVLKEDFAEEIQRIRTEISLLPIISRKDPALALRLARTVPSEFWNTAESHSALSEMRAWTDENPATAALYIEGMPGYPGETLRMDLVVIWSRKNPGAALDWVLRQGNHGESLAWAQEALGALTRSDLPGALARFGAVAVAVQEAWASTLASEWSHSDPAAATAWALRQQEAGLGSAALLSSVQTWAFSDPAAAADFIRGNLSAVSSPTERRALAQAWVHAEPGLPLDQLGALVPTENHDNLFAEAAVHRSVTDPTEAQTVLARIVDPTIRRIAASNLANRWGSQSPMDALDWARSLPPGGEQDSAIRSVFQAWANQRPTEAAGHIPQLDASQRDQALVGLVQTLMNNSPSTAANRSLQVSDPILQAELLESTFQRWGRSDPAAATVWLDRSQLPEALRDRLRVRIR